MRIMLDTNIFVSMIFFPSTQTRELSKRLTDSHQIIVCDYVVDDLPEIRDPKDSPILAAAVMEYVDVFVTGDKDFLVLDIDMPEIVTMADFLKRY